MFDCVADKHLRHVTSVVEAKRVLTFTAADLKTLFHVSASQLLCSNNPQREQIRLDEPITGREERVFHLHNKDVLDLSVQILFSLHVKNML